MSDFNSSEIPNSSDYISRQAAIGLIHSLYPSAPIMRINRKQWEKKYKPYIEAEKALEQLPSAHKTGKWIYKNDLKQFFCSECGYPSLTYDDTYIYGMDLPNYCEDCGADMRDGQ